MLTFSSDEYFNLQPSNSASLYLRSDYNLSISLYIYNNLFSVTIVTEDPPYNLNNSASLV